MSHPSERARTIEQDAANLPVPAPSQEILARVLASRAAGTRVILPTSDPAPQRRSWLVVLRTAAAVAALLLLIKAAEVRLSSIRHRDALTLGLWPSLAFAQTAPAPADGTRTLPSIGMLRGHRIKPILALYERHVRRNGEEIEAPVRARLLIAPDSVSGHAAWRFETGRLDRAHDQQEQSFYDRVTLHPLRRHATNIGRSRFTVDQRFVGDSLLGTMSQGQRARSIARKLPANGRPFLLGEASLVLLLSSVELHSGLAGSFSLVGWGQARDDLYYPVNFAVTGEDHVFAAGNEWDAWRVVVRIGSGMLTVWARKTDGAPLRLRERIGETDYEVTLISEENQ